MTFIPVTENLSFGLLDEYAHLQHELKNSHFLREVELCIEEISRLGINEPPHFHIFFVPRERFHEYCDLPPSKKGHCITGISPNGPGPRIILLVDQEIRTELESFFLEPESTFSKSVIMHELAHIVHGAFFGGLGQGVSEGFAELFVHYIMNIKVEGYSDRLRALPESEMYTLNGLLPKDMWNNPRLRKEKKLHFELNYMSAYLWMRGFIDEVERKFCGNDKIKALNFILHEFKKIDGELDIAVVYSKMASLVGLTYTDLSSEISLQLKAQKLVL